MKKIVIFMVGFFLMAVNLYAADGDFIIDGNLGVGTLTPGVPLQIQLEGGDAIRCDKNNSTPGAGNQIAFRHLNSGSSFFETASINAVTDSTAAGSESGHLRFYTRSSGTSAERLRIAASGNVGIGTTNPRAKLHVWQTDNDSATGVWFQSEQTSGDLFKFIAGNIRSGGGRLAHFYDGGSNSVGDVVVIQSYSSGDSLKVIDGPSTTTFVVKDGGNVGIGTTDPASELDVNGTITYVALFQSSDIKFKKNIKSIESPLGKVIKMKGVSYKWRTEKFKNKRLSDGRHYGVIAQEVEKILPEIVNEGANGDKTVAYTEIIPILIEAIKEQHKVVQEQQKEITVLKAEQQTMKEQQAMISALFEKVNELERQVESQGTVALADY